MSSSKQQYTFSETTFDMVKKLVQAYKTGDLQKLLDAEKGDISREEFDTLLSISASIGYVEGVRIFITHGANINAFDESNETPLHKAVANGHQDTVRFLVSQGAQVNTADQEGVTVLHQAITLGNIEVVDSLIKAGADVNAEDNKGLTALHYAVFENADKIVKTLVSNSDTDINRKDKEGLTPLHSSAFLGFTECTRALVNHKQIDINDLDLNGSSPLHKAAFNGHLEDVKVLIDRGAAINVEDGHSSPLHVAAFGGHLSVVQYLVSKGANIDTADAEGATALHKASFSGHLDIVKLLLTNHADINSHDNEGSTALHKAAFSGKSAVITILLQYGAEVDVQDSDDGTPLHNACFNGNTECVKVLLANQANLNCADANGASPLHLSVLNGHLDVAKFLIENGAQIDSPDDRGMTAMHHAIAHVECLSYLLEKTAEMDLRDNSGRTPLFYAAKNGCVESCKFLVVKGADPNAKDENGQTPMGRATPLAKNVIQEALQERGQKQDTETLKQFKAAAKIFNQKPQKGIDYLIDNNVTGSSPNDISKFLHTAEGLDKNQIGSYLGEGDQFNKDVLQTFCEYMDFSNLELDDALRTYLVKFTLPGEAQKIDRMMQAFAKVYVQNNPNKFPTEDTAYVLSFSLIMLNTDAHNPNVKNKMTKDQFLRNNTGIAGGKNLPREYLEELYSRIVTNEIKMSTQGSVFTSAEKKGWCRKQGGRIKTWKKRYMVLKDNCLYYFKKPDDKDPYGIVPLENVKVRSVTGAKNTFELYSDTNEIKACKKTGNGQFVKGHHGSYVIACESKDEMDSWMSALQNNISFNPLFEIIKKRIEEQQNMRATRATVNADKMNIDFQELYDACLMCSMCYKTPGVIKEAYGAQSLVNEDTDRGLRYFYMPLAKYQSIVIGGNPSESVLSRFQNEFHYGLNRVAESAVVMYSRIMRKELPVNIYGHSFGGALAVILAQQLVSAGYKVEKLITFGQPKIVKETELNQFRSLSILRVVDPKDPYFTQFAGQVHFGPEVLLLEEEKYQVSLKHHPETGMYESSIEYNHVEAYLRNLKLKIKNSFLIE